MFPRCTLFLGFFMLVVAVIDVNANEEPIQDIQLDNVQLEEFDEAEARNPLLAVAIRVLAQAFKWAAKHCLKEAAQNCKSHWKNPKALIQCGGSYLKNNKGRCVTG